MKKLFQKSPRQVKGSGTRGKRRLVRSRGCGHSRSRAAVIVGSLTGTPASFMAKYALIVADRLAGPVSKRFQPPSGSWRRRKYRTARTSRSWLTRSSRWPRSRNSEVIVVLASSWPTQWPSGAWRPSRCTWARAIASCRSLTAVMVTCGLDDGNLTNGSCRRHAGAAPVCIRVPGAVPAGGGSRSRLAAHPGVRRVCLAGGLALGILVDADRRPVRVLPVHRADARPRALYRRHSLHRRPVLHLPRLRGVLPWARRARRPRADRVDGGDRRRCADDGARCRHRPPRG